MKSPGDHAARYFTHFLDRRDAGLTHPSYIYGFSLLARAGAARFRFL